MTLAPAAASGVQTLDDRRGYEIYPESFPGTSRELNDFEGRRLVRSASGGNNTLTITGKAAKGTVVWRFQHPAGITMNGHALAVQSDGVSSAFTSVSFVHTAESRLTWH